jgi:hypothetical protein
MPRWLRIVLLVLLVWAVLFAAWYFLGQVDTEAVSAALRTAG